MDCAHCGLHIGRVPWQQHVCELCLRAIEGGAICATCKQITYRPAGRLCPVCHAESLVLTVASAVPLSVALGDQQYADCEDEPGEDELAAVVDDVGWEMHETLIESA